MPSEREEIIEKIANKIVSDFIENNIGGIKKGVKNVASSLSGVNIYKMNRQLKDVGKEIIDETGKLQDKWIKKGIIFKKMRKMTPEEIEEVMRPAHNKYKAIETARNNEIKKTIGANAILAGGVGTAMSIRKKREEEKNKPQNPYSFI